MINVVNHLDEESWRSFVFNHPHSNIFHSPDMFEVFKRANGYHPLIWGVTDDNNQPIAILPIVHVTLLDDFFRYFTTRAISYGSILFDMEWASRDALPLLLRTYSQNINRKVLFTELRNQSDLNEFQPVLAECGFSFEEHVNFWIPLDRSEEDIWLKISKTGQQRIHSAKRKGVVVEAVNDQAGIDIAYRLLQKVYSRAKVPLANPTLFHAAFEVLSPLEMIQVFLARMEDNYIGARLILIHKGRIIDWYAGADRDYSTYSPNELLVWHTIQWGRANNFSLFDFGGAGNPNEDYGPRVFKAKFGGELVNFGRNTCVHSQTRLKVSKAVFSLVRKFMDLSF
jgi:lipid II:glycine glycyltransferase (peptidoglycan interpeptide bridge formation enzyme)